MNFFDNLTRVPDLTGYEAFIKSLEPFVGNKWDEGNDAIKALKKHIRTQLEDFQNKRCAYCGLEYTWVAYTHIEHIAPKHMHPQFMFEPYNLVGSCPMCNGFSKKSNKKNVETINTINTDYSKCTFIIVHPYYDDPKDHYKFINAEGGIVIQFITPQAKKSGEIFGLNEPNMIEQRAKQFISMHTTAKDRHNQIERIMTTKAV